MAGSDAKGQSIPPTTRKALFWPMVVGTILNPVLGPGGLVVVMSGAYAVVLAVLILPFLGWAFARRGPFALALVIALPLSPVYIPALISRLVPSLAPQGSAGAMPIWWQGFVGSQPVAAYLHTAIWLMFPLWLWTMWRVAMPRQRSDRDQTSPG